jgi:lipopolysaccharide biosynthesis regulator YciM
VSTARKIKRRKGAQQNTVQTLQRALSQLENLGGVAQLHESLAAVPQQVGEVRQLIEALIDDYEAMAQRERLLFALVYRLSETSGERRVHELRQQLREVYEGLDSESEADEGPECQESGSPGPR